MNWKHNYRGSPRHAKINHQVEILVYISCGLSLHEPKHFSLYVHCTTHLVIVCVGVIDLTLFILLTSKEGSFSVNFLILLNYLKDLLFLTGVFIGISQIDFIYSSSLK